jgi:hypothetical protein
MIVLELYILVTKDDTIYAVPLKVEESPGQRAV